MQTGPTCRRRIWLKALCGWDELFILHAPGRTVDLSFGVGLTPDTPNLSSRRACLRMSLWGSKPKKLPIT
jgi:hypothetical protein